MKNITALIFVCVSAAAQTPKPGPTPFVDYRKQTPAEFKAMMEEKLKANRKRYEEERDNGNAGPKPECRRGEPPQIIVDAIKRTLRDPDSLQIIDSWEPALVLRQGPLKQWQIMVKYRAKNSLGGYEIGYADAYVVDGKLVKFKP